MWCELVHTTIQTHKDRGSSRSLLFLETVALLPAPEGCLVRITPRFRTTLPQMQRHTCKRTKGPYDNIGATNYRPINERIIWKMFSDTLISLYSFASMSSLCADQDLADWLVHGEVVLVGSLESSFLIHSILPANGMCTGDTNVIRKVLEKSNVTVVKPPSVPLSFTPPNSRGISRSLAYAAATLMSWDVARSHLIFLQSSLTPNLNERWQSSLNNTEREYGANLVKVILELGSDAPPSTSMREQYLFILKKLYRCAFVVRQVKRLGSARSESILNESSPRKLTPPSPFR
jgi:hypothetical protein